MTLRDLMHRERQNLPQTREKLVRSLSNLQADMNRLFQEAFGHAGQWTSEWASELSRYSPAIDVIENEADFSVRAEVPGFYPDKVDVSVTDGFLTIKGERCETHDDNKQENYLRRETSCGSFQRTIALPPTANLEKAEARFERGILYIAVPKKAEALQKPKKIEIKKVA
jgi:HSP20 family protein